MNTEKNNLLPIISVIVAGAVAITGMLTGGKEVTNSRIEIVDKNTIDRDYETNIESPGYLGGLVHNVQEIFSAGIKAGTSETAVINSSGQWIYQVAGTTGTFSSTLAVTGVTTLTGDLVVNTDDLYVDVSAQMVGIGTTTPGTMLEIYGVSASAGIAPYITINSPTTTDTDFGIIFEDESAQVGTIFFDDSADKLVIATSSSNVDLITIDYNTGEIILNDSVAVTSTLAVGGAATFSTTLGVTGETNLDTMVQGGDVTWVFTTTTLTAAQVCNSSVINIGFAADATMTLTLPTAAALTADCLTTAGDHKVVLIHDAATSTLQATILTGTNIDLEGDDSNADVLAADATAELELYAATSTDTLIGILRPFTNAD